MTAKLFRTSMAVAVSVMVLSIALFMGMLYQYFSDQMMTELESETWLVSRGVELDGMDYLNGLHTTSRVTWVAADGTVLYDNEADASTMENHADREEIREALTSETGTAQRFSSTLSEQTLYVTGDPSGQRSEDGGAAAHLHDPAHFDHPGTVPAALGGAGLPAVQGADQADSEPGSGAPGGL